VSKNKTILVVDDEPDIVNLTEKILKLGAYNTLTCNNGKEALKIIEDKYDEISLVLLDLMMPGVSGMEVLRTIKSNDMFKHILVILFTVKSFKEDIQKGTEMGADGYITKPFSGKQLLEYVNNVFQTH
jgi:DNA-binding response OmpR family regulator